MRDYWCVDRQKSDQIMIAKIKRVKKMDVERSASKIEIIDILYKKGFFDFEVGRTIIVSEYDLKHDNDVMRFVFEEI